MAITTYSHIRIHMYPTEKERLEAAEAIGDPNYSASGIALLWLQEYEKNGWRVSTAIGETLILERPRFIVSEDKVETFIIWKDDWDQPLGVERYDERFPSSMAAKALKMIVEGDRLYGIYSMSQSDFRPLKRLS